MAIIQSKARPIKKLFSHWLKLDWPVQNTDLNFPEQIWNEFEHECEPDIAVPDLTDALVSEWCQCFKCAHIAVVFGLYFFHQYKTISDDILVGWAGGIKGSSKSNDPIFWHKPSYFWEKYFFSLIHCFARTESQRRGRKKDSWYSYVAHYSIILCLFSSCFEECY